MSNIIDTLMQAFTAPDLGGSETPMVIGHTGFVFALRREVPQAPECDVRTVFGCPMSESPQVPAGHFMLAGQLHRYTKPTLDEMVAEALEYLAEELDEHVRNHAGAMWCEFRMAERRLGLAKFKVSK